MKFKKLVAIEPVSLIPSAEKELYTLADEVVLYNDMPATDEEIAVRVGDADAVLLSYTSRLERVAMEKCPNIRYVGMCCSLYTPESANVDIRYAESRGITVTGIRDYGDEGVVEYVVSELVRLLHGFDEEPWEGMPREITGLKVGVVGLGKSGGMIADAMRFFGAEVSYFARSEKAWATEKGYRFLPLKEVLATSDVVFCCLNKNTVLLHEAEFEVLGKGKVLFNTGLSPAWDEAPMVSWLESDPKNRLYCDTLGALGGEKWMSHPQVRTVNVSTGRTKQAFDRLSEKVLNNIKAYLDLV
ncbi:MAG: dihydrofolate reductase [Alistipes sp.]|nr:dihydrofolate reductase [Alistipes sp.]